MTFGEEIRGGGRVERGGGGEGSGATSCLDDFLAGFVRGSDNGGGDDDRPRRISSDGLLGSHVALEETREEVAAAWRTIGDTTTDTEWEEKGGGGSDRVVPTEVRGSESSPASSEGNFPRSSGSEGQPRRQQQHRAPLRQGSSLRPGGRAASVGSTPSVPTASAVGRPEAKASAIPNGMGSVLGSKCFEDRDPATHLSPDEGIEDRNDRSTALDGATTIGGAARRSEGGGNVPPGALRAKENIDRMMSSLLEDVLPSRRNATPSGTILGSPGPGASSGTVNSCVSLPVTAGQPRPAAADSHGTSAPRSSPNHSRSPATSSSRPAMRNPAHPTSGRGRTDDSKDSSGVFLTPIEVIMHAPAGGCGSTDREAGGCRQCAVSAKTPTDGAATGTLQKPPEIASSSVGGGSKVPMLGERRVRNARGLDEQTSTSTHQANGTILSTSNSSSNRSGQNNTNGSSSDSNSARPRRVLSDRGAHQPGVSNGGGAEREAEHSLKREAGVAAPADNNAYESEEQILSTTGAEVALLRRNHATLLRVIREQRERETQVRAELGVKCCTAVGVGLLLRTRDWYYAPERKVGHSVSLVCAGCLKHATDPELHVVTPLVISYSRPGLCCPPVHNCTGVPKHSAILCKCRDPLARGSKAQVKFQRAESLWVEGGWPALKHICPRDETLKCVGFDIEALQAKLPQAEN